MYHSNKVKIVRVHGSTNLFDIQAKWVRSAMGI